MIEFKNVFFEWAEGLSLNDINLKIPQGSFTLITGVSGSGKSTLLRLSCRLEEPQKGTLYYDGVPFTDIAPENLRQKVALIQQTPTILEGSVRDNLLLPYSFTINKNLLKPDDKFLEEKLREFSLDVALDKDANALSVGQKQRLCIIRTLLLEPQVLLMDEPTSALDPESKRIVEKISEDMNAKGVTVMMVSHSEYRPKRPYTHIFVKKGAYEVRND